MSRAVALEVLRFLARALMHEVMEKMSSNASGEVTMDAITERDEYGDTVYRTSKGARARVVVRRFMFGQLRIELELDSGALYPEIIGPVC